MTIPEKSKTEKKRTVLPVLLIGVFLLFLVLPVIALAIPKISPDAELQEKRALADFPKLTEGDAFFGNLSSWFDDHIPFRLRLISAKKKISQKGEQAYRKYVHPVLSELSTPDWYNDPAYSDRKTWDAPYLAPLEDNFAVYGRNDWLFYTGELNMNYFTGTNLLDEQTMQNWKNVFLALQQYCDERGIQLVISVAPNKEQVYPEYVPNYYIETADKRELQLARYMEENGVNYEYLLDEMTAAKPYGDCYQHQDTHWNSLGSFAAFRAMMVSIGQEVPALGEVQINPSTATGGDLSNFCGYATIYSSPVPSYRPEITTLSVDAKTFSGNGMIRTTVSDAPNERSIVLVGDSFREQVEPFLTKEFSRTVAIHRDALREEVALQAVAGLKEGDVLWLLAVERYDSGNAYAAECILNGLNSIAP